MLVLACHGVFANQLLQKQRALYIKAEQTLKQGQGAFFSQQRELLSDYPLYPYLLYLNMARRIAYVKTENIVDFLEFYDGTPVADKLRYKWLRHLAARNNWQLFAQHYRTSPYYRDKELACFYAQSLLQSGRFNELRAKAKQLWLVNFSQPPECDSVFLWGRQTQTINQDLIWQRILLVVKAGRLKLADYLAKQLDAGARKWYALLEQAHYHPFKALAEIESLPKHSPFLHQVLLYSLWRARNKDLQRTHALWQGMEQSFRPYSNVHEQARKDLGVAACWQLEPKIGLYYLSPLNATVADENFYYWRIRCALRLQKWQTVLETIEALSEKDRTSSRWLYWKARALERLGRDEEAMATWKRGASEASYYGYLAADRIGAPYALSTVLPKVERATLNKVRDSDAMKRVYEFYDMDRIFDARREMFYLLPTMDKDESLGIALLCRQWGWATCAIDALGDPMFWHKELELRFPMPYSELVNAQARRANLPAYWIYAVMRRESAFIEDIRSPAGALGLMQLMPATARSVARKIKLSYASNRSLLRPKLNLRLGSTYLKQMYVVNDRDWAAALASYNAGPHRVKKWKSQAPVYNADIWIETIPFAETRRYVRAVLFYAVVYYHKLHHKAVRLKTLIPNRTAG